MKQQELGDSFKKVREDRGISLEEVRRKSKIPEKVLLDIEKGEFDRLGIIYMKSFMKKYAEYLGLDTGDIMKKFESIATGDEKAEVSDKTIFEKVLQQEKAPKNTIKTEYSSIMEEDGDPAQQLSEQLLDLVRMLDNKVIIAGVVAIVFIIALFIGMRSRGADPVSGSRPVKEVVAAKKITQSKKKQQPVVKKTERTKQAEAVSQTKPVEKKVVTVPPVGSAADVKKSEGPAADDTSGVDIGKDGPLVVTLSARGEVWIQVFEKGKTVYVGTLSKGDTKTLKTDDALTVWTGKGENLEFNVNGVKLGKVRDGVVRDINVSRSGIKVGDKEIIKFSS